MTSFEHISVLPNEAVAALAIRPAGCYVDGTFGRGGHARKILSGLDNTGRLIGFDKDPQAITTAQQLASQDSRFSVIQDSFAQLRSQLERLGLCGKLDGVLLDLGVSSPQLDDAKRGFSFMHDGPLDMRMNPEQGQSAAQWLALASAEEIAGVLKEYGEERFARRMAAAIVERRAKQPFTTTSDLAEVISAANPAWEKGKHPATRAFQGIRIHINNELYDLHQGLAAAVDCLAPGGRLAVISFHSLEDRIVKNFMRRQVRGEPDKLPRHLPIMPEPFVPLLKLIGKPLYASEQEVQANPRARSAVLRIAEKLA